MNIFVETSTSGRLIRRVLRDLKRTNWSSKKIVEYFENVVNRMHKKYIEPQKENADMIILNEFSALLEVRHLDMDDFREKNNIPHLD
jgi:uridine kinase